ncbi:MAG: hypothetical protein OEW45_20575 [Deltaproteobacteria bacterium]|nr:hypothetical protein [Deltaproteobacteria bacterium]
MEPSYWVLPENPFHKSFTFVEHEAQDDLRHKFGIDAEGIFQAAEAVL